MCCLHYARHDLFGDHRRFFFTHQYRGREWNDEICKSKEMEKKIIINKQQQQQHK